MKLEVQNKPMSRGVTQLMYVGDDDAVEHATSSGHGVQIAGAALIAVALLGPKKFRTVALALGASCVAFPYLK